MIEKLSVKQVVSVSAGFDGLCFQLSQEGSGVVCYEHDHPNTQLMKKRWLKSFSQKDDFPIFVSADLEKESFKEVLLKSGFDMNAPSVFVIEGLLMYLSQSAVEKLLKEISEIASQGSVVVAGVMSGTNQDSFQHELRDKALTKLSEQYNWTINKEELGGWLDKYSFALKEYVTYAEMQADLRSVEEQKKLAQVEGEHYFIAEKTI